MSDNHSEEQHIGIPGYLGVFTVLIVGTIATYFVATIDLKDLAASADAARPMLASSHRRPRGTRGRES